MSHKTVLETVNGLGHNPVDYVQCVLHNLLIISFAHIYKPKSGLKNAREELQTVGIIVTTLFRNQLNLSFLSSSFYPRPRRLMQNLRTGFLL